TGKAQYSCFPNGKGGIVDDLLVYHFEENKYLLVVNASNIEKDWNWCTKNNTEGAELENASDWMAQLAVQGPKATELLQKLTTVDLAQIPYYGFAVGDFAGVENVILSNTGYTGAGGFELYFYPEYGEKIWNALFTTGEAYGIKPIGLGARDSLRLEKGFCLYGNDIDDTTSPIEAGLGWITKFVEGKRFIDRELLEKQKTAGVDRKLVRFELKGRGIPRHEYEIVNENNDVIGHVTSGTMLPDSKKGIGMGYVQTAYCKPGSTIFIKIRANNLEAVVVK
ncbi:MAG: glycine cleavage system aminomethyltransferase GcvT, partial [Bacteroidota bacterium]|nr:glycine cleavage system aminomethyltransferase GcvT [Bacteroidota bacterium]